MPTLNWIGKEKVVKHHLDVPYKILESSYCYGEKEDAEHNKIIHGDNLEALKSLLPEYEGKIKCIYIDPPYNTGNEGWVYNDNVNHPKVEKWLGEVVGKEGEDLSRHDKWICMMYPRLKLLKSLLSEDGAIFISIDDTEYHILKNALDEIFGLANYITSIVWQKIHSSKNDAKYLSVNHEYVLFYAKKKDKLKSQFQNAVGHL
jgi:adenine-specific DNA-methyltransferase